MFVIKVSAGNGNNVFITGTNGVEMQRAQRLFMDLISVEKVHPIPKDVSSQNRDFQKLRVELEGSMAIKIDYRTSNEILKIYGLEEAVKKAKSKIEQFFKSVSIKSERYTPNLTADMWTFLEMHLDEVKRATKVTNVTVKLEKQQQSGNHQICITGNPGDVSACKNVLKKVLFQEIAKKDEKVAYPGLKKLFGGNKHNNWLKRIAEKWKVSIHIKIEPASNSSLPAARLNPLLPHRPRFATVSHSDDTQNVFRRFNFTTMEGLKLSCKFGRIENEKVGYEPYKYCLSKYRILKDSALTFKCNATFNESS